MFPDGPLCPCLALVPVAGKLENAFIMRNSIKLPAMIILLALCTLTGILSAADNPAKKPVAKPTKAEPAFG